MTYPAGDLGPGGGPEQAILTAVALEPLDRPKRELLRVEPADAKSLCGRSLDWIEIAKPNA